MSSDVLRRAAAKLRTTVEKATPGPWTIEQTNGSDFVMDADRAAYIASCGYDDNAPDDVNADAAWIALASPAIAEPLAAWLEATAARLDRQALAVWHESAEPHAFTVARAVLGEEVP